MRPKGRIKVTATCPKGIGHERIKVPHNRLERLYRLAWQETHIGPIHSTSTCSDLLAQLLTDYNKRKSVWHIFPDHITKRDRVVAATVIQWLGSTVGNCFVQEVLRKHQNGLD
jgi:hypothetical protein